MFTFMILYVIGYFLTLSVLFFYILSYDLTEYVAQNSFTVVWFNLIKYFSNGWVLKFLLLQLSGLPPFFFFFVKFDFLLKSIISITLYLQILLFLNLLVGTFFYLKIFYIKSFKLSNAQLKNSSKNQEILKTNLKKTVNQRYRFWFSFYSYTFFNIFSFIFFCDAYIICKYFFI